MQTEQATLGDEDLATRHAVVECCILQRDADAETHIVGVGHDIEPTDAGPSLGGQQQSAQHAHDGGLACAVGTQKSVYLSFTDLEIDAVDRGQLAESPYQTFRTNCTHETRGYRGDVTLMRRMGLAAVSVRPMTTDPESTSAVSLHTEGDVAVIRIDDGKANALGHATMDALNVALDDAADAKAVVLFGREGKFSAGFDLAVMKDGPAAAQAMVKKGAQLCMRLYGFPTPVLAGSNGHALAAGALVLLSCDVRVAADTPGRIGLPETTIGMPLPVFATELARDRLSRRHFTAATLLGTTYSPIEALDVGYVDQVVPVDEMEATVLALAKTHGDAVSPSGFAKTRINTRQTMIDLVDSSLDADMAAFSVQA